MAVEMLDWSPDFCLSCDRQSMNGGAYCSQSCRLADLERASGSSNAQSLQSPTSNWASSNSSNGFHLPPALNFSAMSSRRSSSSTTSTPATRSPLSSTPPTTYQASQSYYTPEYPRNGRHSLYSSPSRSSLSSLGSSTNQQESLNLSEKARSELHDYANSFDQTRSYKRRFTVV